MDTPAAIGEAEFVAVKRRNAAGIGGGTVVEKIAGVEGGVAQEFESRTVNRVGAGAGDDIGETCGAAADFGGHPTGAGANFLHGIHVEVGEGGAADFGIAAIGAVHGEDGGRATLAVHGELLGKVGGAVGVGHGAGGEEE